MSVNYHAFQSRGVPFAEYEVVCAQWRTEFSGYDPTRIAGILNLQYDEKWLHLAYFGLPYRLCLSDGHLERQTGDRWTEELYFNESMAVYHLLHYTKDRPRRSGTWVPSHTIDGVVSRSRAADPLLDPFAKRYSGRTEELAAACRRLGGRKLEKGDAGYQFEPFFCLPMRLLFWDADEDFPAQAQILVDEYVTDFVHFETVGCIISDLLEKLEAEA